MLGNGHVRFLGGPGVARRRAYLTALRKRARRRLRRKAVANAIVRQRRAATIGVIQMSPIRSRAARSFRRQKRSSAVGEPARTAGTGRARPRDWSRGRTGHRSRPVGTTALVESVCPAAGGKSHVDGVAPVTAASETRPGRAPGLVSEAGRRFGTPESSAGPRQTRAHRSGPTSLAAAARGIRSTTLMPLNRHVDSDTLARLG